ncbi:hypothetical protein GCM10009530_08060 [Microbispora corallina]|uniref:Uncharacterized protein n=1 Tax=Microbispora corallina TaxID=83302 RepID=A0ABQ4FVB7_9ACTN|nr:hypothetical protein Mco01_17690 [Microbispora corallina]
MVGRLSVRHVPRVQEDRRLQAKATPLFSDRGRGDTTVVIAHAGANRLIREAEMNGHLPYRDSSPAPRVGGPRGWQADILRGQS